MADDPLDGPCAQVGRFLYHFANLEDEINQALSKLLKLSPVAADWIIHNVSPDVSILCTSSRSIKSRTGKSTVR